MAQSIMVPVTGQGTVVDHGLAKYLPQMVQAPFHVGDVFLYSHGWWTTAQAAMIDYSRFSVGMLGQVLRLAAGGAANRPAMPLEVGIHWPAMISEDSESVISVLQPLTFYNRAAMADDVGEHGGGAILRLLLEAAPAALRFHLIGHSFGCRVVCSALENLIEEVGPDRLAAHQFNLVLLQGAFDTDAMEVGQTYGRLLGQGGVPNLRVLVTRSDEDTAVRDEYPRAFRLIHLFGRARTGIGATGPSAATPGASAALRVAIGSGFQPPPGFRDNRFVIADLTPLHRDGTVPAVEHSGHHSDIYRDEIYRLITAFLL